MDPEWFIVRLWSCSIIHFTISIISCTHNTNNDPSIHLCSLQAHLELGNAKDAMLAARDAVTAMPTSSIAYTLIGQCLSRSSTGTDVIKAYKKALRMDPLNTKAASYMAEFYKKQGKLHEASLCLKSILEFPVFGKSYQTYELRTQLAKILGKPASECIFYALYKLMRNVFLPECNHVS